MKIAYFKKNLVDFTGDAALFKVHPAIEWERYDERGNKEKKKSSYIVVSRTDVPYSGLETYIFPASASGKVLSWLELSGSRRGDVGITEVLEDLGYKVTR